MTSIAIPTAWCGGTARQLEQGAEVERAILLAALGLHAAGHQDREVRRAVVDALPNAADRPGAWLSLSALLKLEV